MATKQNVLGRIDAGREIRRPPLVGMQFLHQGTVSAADVATLARRLTEALRQPFEADGQRIEVSASIGVAIYPEHGERAKLIAQGNELFYKNPADFASYLAADAKRMLQVIDAANLKGN